MPLALAFILQPFPLQGEALSYSIDVYNTAGNKLHHGTECDTQVTFWLSEIPISSVSRENLDKHAGVLYLPSSRDLQMQAHIKPMQ